MYERIASVSPRIDSCGGLIAQQAHRAYGRIARDSPEHLRWLDEDDIRQDALLKAVEVEQEYKAFCLIGRVAPQKYSSHLYNGLFWRLDHLARTYARPIRRSNGLVELDAPVSTETNERKIDFISKDGPEQIEERLACISGFIELCRAVSDPAKMVLILGFLFSDSRYSTPELCAEIGQAAARLRVGINDLRLIGHDPRVRKLLLVLIGKCVMLNAGTEEQLRCLECVRCHGHLSIRAIRTGQFFVSTMTCRRCYREMKQSPVEVSCFGKTADTGGYSVANVECRLHCRDRSACRYFQENDMADNTPDIDDVDFSDVEGTATAAAVEEKPKKSAAKKTKKEVKKAPEAAPAKKAAKAAKKEPAPAAAKKDVDDDDEPKPPKGCEDWPGRKGSLWRYIFVECYRTGYTIPQLRKMLAKAGWADMDDEKGRADAKSAPKKWGKYHMNFQIYWMKRLVFGRYTAEKLTHSWKLHDEDGVYRPYDLKQLKFKGDKKAEKGATKAKPAAAAPAKKKTAKKKAA